MKSSFFIVLMAFFLCGCAATIHSFHNETNNVRIVRMSGNKLAGGIWRIELDVQRHEKKGRHSYSLFVVYSGPGFVTIESGKSLSLIIDGRRTDIEGGGSVSHRGFILPGLVEETAFYHDIDKGLIREIAYAHQITVEVRGTKAVIQRRFKELNFINFKTFYEDIVLKDPASNSLPHENAQILTQ